MAPRMVERNIFWAISASRNTDSVPIAAAEKRQPKLLDGPKSHMPKAIIHLPTGGCTTYSGVFCRELKSPNTKWSLALSAQFRSKPLCSRE